MLPDLLVCALGETPVDVKHCISLQLLIDLGSPSNIKHGESGRRSQLLHGDRVAFQLEERRGIRVDQGQGRRVEQLRRWCRGLSLDRCPLPASCRVRRSLLAPSWVPGWDRSSEQCAPASAARFQSRYLGDPVAAEAQRLKAADLAQRQRDGVNPVVTGRQFHQ